ncbi:DUF4013 domain-containing protein [Haloplanus aerogenes]|uniref:DUF4013 domain-containing protein n=1 Tax=Haloplanus aerogenes TaxID=660522 RepID=A0A3M0D9L1_9EURY|nr:DUF4013 domain-containing protein [Haloplanus aerogenes]AZH26429.1 DUF4013 domain-containing protein [Haloplanus aerogenes]RMB18107.1 uncharacterized protein DUF4013 [Haloplanus aerogenes]
MISESLSYLRTSDDWVKTVVIGGLLTLLGFLVVPTILVAGYLVRVLRATMHGDETPPRFDDWGDLAGDGVRAFVIAVVYGLVPAVLIGVTAAFAGLAAGPGPRSGLIVGGVAFVGGLLALVVGLLAAYIIPAALANYAEQGSVRAGFAVGDLRPILTSGTYATAWVMGFAVVFVAAVVTALLNVVPLLGTVVGAFVSFYAITAAYYIVGHAWGDLRGLDLHDDEGEMGAERPAV